MNDLGQILALWLRELETTGVDYVLGDGCRCRGFQLSQTGRAHSFLRRTEGAHAGTVSGGCL